MWKEAIELMAAVCYRVLKTVRKKSESPEIGQQSAPFFFRESDESV